MTTASLATTALHIQCENHIYHHTHCPITCEEQECPLTQPDAEAKRKADIDGYRSNLEMYAGRMRWCKQNGYKPAARRWADAVRQMQAAIARMEAGE